MESTNKNSIPSYFPWFINFNGPMEHIIMGSTDCILTASLSLRKDIIYKMLYMVYIYVIYMCYIYSVYIYIIPYICGIYG